MGFDRCVTYNNSIKLEDKMRAAELLVQLIIGLLVGIGWLGGIVIAKGAWSTGFAICLPPYAWYLIVEKFMMVHGLI